MTFGDESAVRADRRASIISVLAIFLIWGAFTGSKIVPPFLHAPGPFTGDTVITYTVATEDGQRDDATITARVHTVNEDPGEVIVEPGDGFAKNDTSLLALGARL